MNKYDVGAVWQEGTASLGLSYLIVEQHGVGYGNLAIRFIHVESDGQLLFGEDQHIVSINSPIFTKGNWTFVDEPAIRDLIRLQLL